MWRAKPLLKMTLRMFFYSAAIFTITHTLGHLLHSEFALNELSSFAFAVALWSVVPALVLALPLPVFTILFFREIRRPAFYRFAMLTVALIATAVVWAEDYAMIGDVLKYHWELAGYAIISIAGNSLAVYMSVVVAGKYAREAAEQPWQLHEN